MIDLHNSFVVLFVLGVILISLGAEFFVKGAVRLAAIVGVSPLVIGLTVVAFGTSTPEVAVVLEAGFAGKGDLAFGNIVGSNISNFLLILGISAIAAPLVVSQRLIKIEVPFLLLVSIIVLAMGLDGQINRLEGLILLLSIVIYSIVVLKKVRGDKDVSPEEYARANSQMINPSASVSHRKSAWVNSAVMLTLGLMGLIVGAGWLVNGASEIARLLGVSELVIGLTVVAVGTSLPELATSIAASLRGERDIAIGNVIGSNLFNLTFVIGSGALILPQGLGVPGPSISFDLPVMIATVIACLPIFYAGYNINRWEGLLFLVFYGAYVLYLFLFSTEHDLLSAYSTFMLWYIFPATAFLLLFILIRARYSRSK
jgi:cation:H+ antiporter